VTAGSASRGYASDDLAYVHDIGFHSYALEAAPGLLGVLRDHSIKDGLVVDLGSGTGTWAAELVRLGYGYLGFDQSAAMVRFAKKAVPGARFRKASLFDAPLPRCRAVTSMGECLNYRFTRARSSMAALKRLFKRVYAALEPGGVFVFDLATPARAPKKKTPRVFRNEGEDWAMVAVSTAIPDGLRRSMTFFRRHGDLYRRGAETHDLTLYPLNDILAALRDCGFRARKLSPAGFPTVRGMAWIVCEKQVS
jgi:SAM-dependent methyltransferase